ncbi:hypothetical protein [Synechocystis sp. LKSZ1]|uniref:hypothetical protein n=1 Tax=Synechocystis sp. LKSZ1 TaxID=3144951 RepID=UPI00336BCA6E
MVWVNDDTLTFLPKYPIIEYLDFLDEDTEIVELLNMSPIYWNTYYFWQDQIKFSLLQHDQDFKVQLDYKDVISEAIKKSALNSLELFLQLGLDSE